MANDNIPRKPADQFVPKPKPEPNDLFVFWDRISKKMARASIDEFTAWLKSLELFALFTHRHSLDQVDNLQDNLSGQRSDIAQLQTEMQDILNQLNKPPAKPTGVEWEVEPGITLGENKYLVDATGVARWYGEPVPYPEKELPTEPAPTDDKIRVDVIYAWPDGTYDLEVGNPGLTASRPAIPAGTLWVRDVIVRAAGSQVTEPVVAYDLDFDKFPHIVDPQTTDLVALQRRDGSKAKLNLLQLRNWLGIENISNGTNYNLPE